MNAAATQSKDALIRKIGLLVRQMGAQSTLSSVAIAKRFGIHASDLEALDLIFIRKEASAGDLAKATGLTSGSITALIDRLAAKGYVTRHDDPGDRRKTIVRVNRRMTAQIEAAYAPRQKAMHALWSEFTPDQLEAIGEFLDKSTRLLAQHSAGSME